MLYFTEQQLQKARKHFSRTAGEEQRKKYRDFAFSEDSFGRIASAKEIGMTGLSKDGTACSPGVSSAGSVVASGELCPALAAGTTSRRNRRWPRAWHPGPSNYPAGRRSELEESKLRAEGGARRTGKRERGGRAGGERATIRRRGGSISTPYAQSRSNLFILLFLSAPLLSGFQFGIFNFPSCKLIF